MTEQRVSHRPGSVLLDRVTQRFNDVVALDDVSLEIADGEFLVLLGPSGCGKSTLLRIIAGLIAPTAGRVILGERDITALQPGDRDVAMVFQSYALYPHLTVEKNLGFGLRVRHHPRDEVAGRVREVAGQLDLSELLARRPKELSGGQRQRVALGRAMVRDPRVFLMDEPLSNLDAQLRTATRVELASLHRRLRTTFVYVTHDQVEAMTMATRIAVLNRGRLEQVGSPAEIYDDPASTFVAGFIGSPGMNLLSGRIYARTGSVRVEAEGVDLEFARGEVDARDVVVGFRPEHLRLRGPGEPSSGPAALQGIVAAVENLGSEEIAFCELGSARVALRGARPLGVTDGARVSLEVAPGRLCIFDPASGRRLRWVDDPVVLERGTPVAAGRR